MAAVDPDHGSGVSASSCLAPLHRVIILTPRKWTATPLWQGMRTGHRHRLHYRRAPPFIPTTVSSSGFKHGDFPVAETVSDRIVSLPLFPLMTDADQDRGDRCDEDLFK